MKKITPVVLGESFFSMGLKIVVPVSYFKSSPKSTLLSVDIATHHINVVGEYTAIEGRKVKGKGFTQIASTGHHFVVADYNQFHFLDRKNGKIVKTISSEDLNDIHGVYVRDNFIIITNTGLDSVKIYDLFGVYLNTISLLSFEDTLARYSGDSFNSHDEYYNNDKEKPFRKRVVKDKFHLNNSIILNNQIISTSFTNKTLMILSGCKEISPPLGTYIHDCLHFDHQLWVTSVDGKIYHRSDDINQYLPLEEYVDLFKGCNFYGWCRGLTEYNGDFFVGITQVNSKTTMKRWNVDVPIEQTKSGVIRFNIKKRCVVDFFDLTHENISRIFGFIVE